MKTLSRSNDKVKLENLFANMEANKLMSTLWQNDNGVRKVFLVRVKKIVNDEVHFFSYYRKQLNFSGHEVYLYCEKLNFIAKSEIIKCSGVDLVARYPDEVKLLDAIDNTKMSESFGMMSSNSGVDRIGDKMVHNSTVEKRSDLMRVKKVNEDQEFAHLRESPRLKSKKQQTVLIEFNSKKYKPKTVDLFDLSQGGAGLIVKTPEQFDKGDFITLLKLDSKDLNPTLKGEVMSIRVQDTTKGEYKIGLRFG